MAYTIKSINTSPTMADLRAIETTFNKKIDDDYTAMKAKYPEYDIENYKNMEGEILYGTVTNRINPPEKHATSGELLFWVENQIEGVNDKVARDYLNAIEALTLKVPVTDDKIFYCNTLRYDHHRQIVGQEYDSRPIKDEVMKNSETGEDVLNKGLETLISEGKLHIHLYEDGRSNIIEVDGDGTFADES